MYAKDNIGSWIEIYQFIDSFSDSDGWQEWQQIARDIIFALDEKGLRSRFRVGQSLHHIIFSTKETHGLLGEPRVTLEINLRNPTVRVAYSHSNLHFEEPESDEICKANEAIPTIIDYLKRLWIETKPDSPIPEAIKR